MMFDDDRFSWNHFMQWRTDRAAASCEAIEYLPLSKACLFDYAS